MSAVAEFDISAPNPARMWNYWLGGKDNFATDRAAGDEVIAALPTMPLVARAARRFLIDAVYQLVTTCGVRQFIDIGSGLPAADNTHEVAQRAAPGARVLYVDHDPVVVNHGQVLLASADGTTEMIQADLRDTPAIIAAARDLLDLTQPVAVLLIAVLHFIPDAEDPPAIVARLMDALPPGSYLVIGHGASDIEPAAAAELTRRYNERSPVKIRLRSRAEILPFFDGLELVGRGLVPLGRWWGDSRPGDERPAADPASGLVGHVGIARKA
jgi:O-methyltransferase involved in polyketide biosynthesis